MKIALCLHGLFNSTFDQTSNGLDGFHYIKKHILDRKNVDVFIHNWDLGHQDLIRNLYCPKLALFEPLKDWSKEIGSRGLGAMIGAPRPPQNVLGHFYSIQQVFKL